MLDLERFRRYAIVPSPAFIAATKVLFDVDAFVTRTRVRVEGLERLPSAPALLATNSTQKYDFMPIRWAMHQRGVRMVTITKAKNYHSPAFAYFLGKTGVVPLASRGYFLTFDFEQVCGRRPSEEEYRALRDHVDHGTPLPASCDPLTASARDILGERFEPSHETYRDAIERLYRRMMGESLRLCREALDAGHHVQIYPEGTVSSRLARGRIGAVQFAIALGVPIVPIGMSGCRAAMRSAFLAGGTIDVRIGDAMTVRAPDGFRPFDPTHERAHRALLESQTAELMRRIDPLLDEPFRAREGFVGDGTQGTARFL